MSKNLKIYLTCPDIYFIVKVENLFRDFNIYIFKNLLFFL